MQKQLENMIAGRILLKKMEALRNEINFLLGFGKNTEKEAD